MTVRYSKDFAKTAGPRMDMLKSIVTNPNFVIPTAAPLAAMAVGAGANKIRDVLSDAIEARRKAEAYKAMIAAHPHFKSKPEKDLRNIYNSVYNINPTMAKDPLVAGALLDRIYTRQESFGGHEGTSNQGLLETVQDITKIRSDLASAQEKELKLQGRTDFTRPAEMVASNMVGSFGKIMDDMGEVGRLKRQIEDRKQQDHAKYVEQQLRAFEGATGGMKPTPDNLRTVGTMAHAADLLQLRKNKNRALSLAGALRNQAPPRGNPRPSRYGDVGRAVESAFNELRNKKR